LNAFKFFLTALPPSKLSVLRIHGHQKRVDQLVAEMEKCENFLKWWRPVMRPEDLSTRIEEAFAGLDPPCFEELAAADCSIEDEFLDAVESRTWRELRPLRQYIGAGGEIVVLSAKAYQYYIPAYLFALIDEAGDEYYLDHVLDSLWYEDGLKVTLPAYLFFIPPGGWEELMPEIEKQMPHLTYQERQSVAEIRVNIAVKMAKVTEMTGRDWSDRSYLRDHWEERMPLLTSQQKSCIAAILLHVLERTTYKPDADRIENMLDKYWRAFLLT
jgi:hypothetical protein